MRVLSSRRTGQVLDGLSWVMKMKTVKPEPLLLEGPEGEQRFASFEPQRAAARRPSQETVAAARQAQVEPVDEELVVETEWKSKRPDEFIIEGNERG